MRRPLYFVTVISHAFPGHPFAMMGYARLLAARHDIFTEALPSRAIEAAAGQAAAR